MFIKLAQNSYNKVKILIKNTNHELSIDAVITGNAPGEIYVDNEDLPTSTLIVTPECTVIAGAADNHEFNKSVKDTLDFYDQVTCDNEAFEDNIDEIHKNASIRKYKRRCYKLDALKYNNFAEDLDKDYTLEYVTVDMLDKVDYENFDEVKEWFHFSDLSKFKDYCLGSYIRKGNKLVSWCLVDCIVDDKIEIGITTDEDFRRKGLGAIVTAATVNCCLSKGIKEIGWHCVDSNVGSYSVAEKVGFKMVKEYTCFTPYPPIENGTDLNSEQWSEWAHHYEVINEDPKTYRSIFYFEAAHCFASACKIDETINAIEKLIAANTSDPIQDMLKDDIFSRFKDNDKWNKFIEKLRNTN